MRNFPQWHQLSAARYARERQRLTELPYFTLETASIDKAGKFTAIGLLHFTGTRSGANHELRIRLEFPSQFPRAVPRVFDHDRRFKPSLDGHLFTTYELCLTLPERHEFSLGQDGLTEEILGAALIWFHKRLIFDKTNHWPGIAERHGINAVIDLLVERQVVTDASAINEWLMDHAATSEGTPREPDLYAPCPCGSGKRLKFCHRDELRAIFTRLAQLPADCKLATALEFKG